MGEQRPLGGGQHGSHEGKVGAERSRVGIGGGIVEADDDARSRHAQLAGDIAQRLPDQMGFGIEIVFRRIGAIRAALRAVGTVVLARAEMPFGEGPQAFFRCSRIRPGVTTWRLISV